MIQLKYKVLAIVMLVLGVSCKEAPKEASKEEVQKKPNIVVIYVDDLGYGDVGFNGATEIKTPNLDKLANEGVRFTNGYASSATCTPSRYALLTGVYPWRNKNAKILPGTAPLIISTEQMTIPKMLKTKGYYTGIVGKWHLGLGTGNVNWNETVSPGPNEVGFEQALLLIMIVTALGGMFIGVNFYGLVTGKHGLFFAKYYDRRGNQTDKFGVSYLRFCLLIVVSYFLYYDYKNGLLLLNQAGPGIESEFVEYIYLQIYLYASGIIVAFPVDRKRSKNNPAAKKTTDAKMETT